MNQPQRNLKEPLSTSGLGESSGNADLHLGQQASDESVSPALLLQEKLNQDLQAAPVLDGRFDVILSVLAFVAACAGTWGFGALLYLQV